MERGIRFGLVAFALLFAANEVLAQFGGGFPGGGMSGRRGSRSTGDSDKSAQRPGTAEPRPDTFQTTLEELRIDLKLDVAQQVAWNAYAEKLVALMNDSARERARGQPGITAAAPQTAPQQLDRLVMSAQNRATAIEDAATAAKTLYEKLTPQQKSMADGRLASVTSLAIAPQGEAARPRR